MNRFLVSLLAVSASCLPAMAVDRPAVAARFTLK
jgi:hypothetical protein